MEESVRAEQFLYVKHALQYVNGHVVKLKDTDFFVVVLGGGGGGAGRVAQSVGHLTRKLGVLGSIPGLATYFRFSFRFFQKGQMSVSGESMRMKYWSLRRAKLSQEKCG